MGTKDKDTAKAVKLAKKLGISDADFQALIRAAQDTWQYIGYDILQANDGKDIPRAEVIDVVLDADYIVSNNPKLPEPVKTILKSYDPEKMPFIREAMKLAFPYAHYGM